MPTYLVRYRSKGTVQSTQINAQSAEAAKIAGARYGSILGVERDFSNVRRRGMRTADRYTFLLRLSTMLASKVSTAEALRLMRSSFSGAISDAANTLLSKVEAGVDLPTAISEDRKHFPGPVGLIVKVGARGGQIYQALNDAAEFEHKLHQVKEGSGRTIVSAVFGFVIAGILVAVSVFYIGPQIMKMGLIESQKGSVDVSWVNTLAKGVGILICFAAFVLFGLFWLATMGRRLFPILADTIILKIPYYSDIVMAHDNYLTLRRLALLLGGGIRVEEALQSAYETAKRGMLQQDLGRAMQALKRGKKWSDEMKTLHPTDRAALSLAADRTQIAKNLNAIAEQAQSLYMQRVNGFAPILLVLSALSVSMAGVVLFGQSVLPMLQVASSILK